MKTIEKRDSVLTSAQQIDRLLRPGSKYSNLNPYDVSAYTDSSSKHKGAKEEVVSLITITHTFPILNTCIPRDLVHT